MMRRIGIICLLIMALQLILSTTVMPVSADNGGTEGVPYTEPKSAHTTYNMNLDWKFFATTKGATANETQQTAMAEADKNGKHFYEKDYDDSSWETVSIPHVISAQQTFTQRAKDAGGSAEMGIFLYRKTFTLPQGARNGKIFFELEGIRQAAYLWVNGKKVGYYEAGVTAMGFDITSFIDIDDDKVVIAILNDATATRGNTGRMIRETVPGEPWGSSQNNTNDSYMGIGQAWQWNTRDFNELQTGLTYDAYLHITGQVYQTLPLYNNLKTTGNYIYANNFNIRGKSATISVDAEIRNESADNGNYTLEVDIVDADGNLVDSFRSAAEAVPAAGDKGIVYETAVEGSTITPSNGTTAGTYSEDNPYYPANLEKPEGITKINTVDVTHIKASKQVNNLRFWSTDDPYLYTVYTVLKDSSNQVVDVQKKVTGFRKVSYDKNSGVLINDKPVWLTGYAQRSVNEWAVIGIAPDWLQDYDMQLQHDGNKSNFIRWMHVAPKPNEVRSSDKYGVAIAAPAGDKESPPSGRQWSQRVEAMRDTIIYFRNSPSVIFYETGNNPVAKAGADNARARAEEMFNLRETLDPYGMRFIGARTTTDKAQLNYEWNYAGTMCAGPDPGSGAIKAMGENGIYGPIMETEFSRNESARRVWDDYSPPDYDYVNKWLGAGAKKTTGYDVYDQTQEEITLYNIRDYSNTYYQNRAGQGKSYYSATAMMIWADSDQHGRSSGTENCRTSGRVDAVRQTKEMYEGTRVAQSTTPDVHIIGHWSYPEDKNGAYTYRVKEFKTDDSGVAYWQYTNKTAKRDPKKKSVYVIGSEDVKKVELYRIDRTDDGEEMTLLGTDNSAEALFIYQFDNIDITKGDAVIAKAYNSRGKLVATHKIERTGAAYELRLTPVTSDEGWRADGSDIMFFDVEVVDENGNVCPLNYDRIDFTTEGDDFGTYMGGYNSGSGNGCFTATDTVGAEISGYFRNDDGSKYDKTSTIYAISNEKMVFAENGTNRIFVKATRDAGTFTLKASMYGGTVKGEASVTSKAVEGYKNGLTTQFTAKQHRDAGDAPVQVEVGAMYPIAVEVKDISWIAMNKVVKKDTNTYYPIYVNGENLNLAGKSRARLGTMDMAFGPIIPVLDKLGYSYNYDSEKNVLTFNGVDPTGEDSAPQLCTIEKGRNAAVMASGAESEIIQEPEIIDGKLFVSLSAVLAYIPGVKVVQTDPVEDDPETEEDETAAARVDITYTVQ